MKKAILLFSFFFFLASVNFGQGITSIGAGFDVAIPAGDLADALDLSAGFGGDAKAEYMFDKKVGLTGSIGYMMWSGDNDVTMSDIPIVVGGKYYFNQGFYGMAELGIHMLSWEWEFTDDDFGGMFNQTVEADESKFGFGVGAGYEMPLQDRLALDLSARYQFIEDFNNLILRAGIKYQM